MRALKFVLGLAVCGAFSVSPATALASSISGTVTAEGGGAIQGIEVCTRANPYVFEDTCVETNASGDYKVDNLPGDSYYLAFFSHNNHLNYVSESYNDKLAFLGDGDLLSLGAGQSLTGIDAELEKGGVITGTATDAETHGPAAGVWVCVEAVGSIPFGICLRAGPDGKYESTESRPANTWSRSTAKTTSTTCASSTTVPTASRPRLRWR
ncbi:MAG TPA: carboxypeptidase-like regulatory domain-containing protein [Solirubrobacterales bacterium]|nr:carboxypeptidase-like regulatory domain-containing protein [Solirubrobacterales bacterium]